MRRLSRAQSEQWGDGGWTRRAVHRRELGGGGKTEEHTHNALSINECRMSVWHIKMNMWPPFVFAGGLPVLTGLSSTPSSLHPATAPSASWQHQPEPHHESSMT